MQTFKKGQILFWTSMRLEKGPFMVEYVKPFSVKEGISVVIGMEGKYKGKTMHVFDFKLNTAREIL